jgi:hypothetical protein
MVNAATTTESPWADGDVQTVYAAIYGRLEVEGVDPDEQAEVTSAVLDALAPRVAELQRAAKVEALWWAADSFANQGEVDAADHVTALAFQIRRGEA